MHTVERPKQRRHNNIMHSYALCFYGVARITGIVSLFRVVIQVNTFLDLLGQLGLLCMQLSFGSLKLLGLLNLFGFSEVRKYFSSMTRKHHNYVVHKLNNLNNPKSPNNHLNNPNNPNNPNISFVLTTLRTLIILECTF